MPIKLIAHRGYAARYPENTLPAIEAAIEGGAQFVEVDVQLTADGAPVLFHDRTLDRMCGVPGAMADYSLQQLADFSASEQGRFGETFAGTPVATLRKLAELIRRFPDIQFFIELKRISIKHHGADRMLEQTTRTLKGLQQQCTLISFDAEIPRMARSRGWRTGLIGEWGQVLNEGSGLGFMTVNEGPGLGFMTGQKAKQTTINPRPDPFLLSTDFLFCDIDGLPPSGDLYLADIQLAVYEVADPEQAQSLAARGVDFIETFSIGEMRAALS